MSEFERLLHLIVSLQILFGSRRGGIWVPLIIIGLAVGGWIAYKSWYDPSRALERADQLWDSGDFKQRVAAIKEYKYLLRKSDPLDSNEFWLKNSRKSLYQKIIEFHVKYEGTKSDAREWLQKAWAENIRSFDFGADPENKELNEFAKAEIEEIKKHRDPFQID